MSDVPLSPVAPVIFAYTTFESWTVTFSYFMSWTDKDSIMIIKIITKIVDDIPLLV